MTTMRNNIIHFVSVVLLTLALGGCGAGQKKNERGFFTSGNREADQRADQRMASARQIRESGPGDKGDKKDDKQEEVRKTLYERLGGEQGVRALVDDFVSRALADPRVNWERKNVKRGGLINRTKSVEWKATDENVEQMKKHIVQFISLSTGGPSFYDGREMKDVHAGLHIRNDEFDAAIGDLKMSLDAKQIPDKEQRELLSIVESTRTQVVQEK